MCCLFRNIHALTKIVQRFIYKERESVKWSPLMIILSDSTDDDCWVSWVCGTYYQSLSHRHHRRRQYRNNNNNKTLPQTKSHAWKTAEREREWDQLENNRLHGKESQGSNQYIHVDCLFLCDSLELEFVFSFGSENREEWSHRLARRVVHIHTHTHTIENTSSSIIDRVNICKSSQLTYLSFSLTHIHITVRTHTHSKKNHQQMQEPISISLCCDFVYVCVWVCMTRKDDDRLLEVGIGFWFF